MLVDRIATPHVKAVSNKTPTPNTLPAVSFGGILQKTKAALQNLDQESVMAQLDLVSGSARDLHTAALSVEKAGLALDLVVAVRNKALEAYQEIMRMPV